MLSLVLERWKLGQELAPSNIQMKLPNGSTKPLRNLFHSRPTDLLAAFRASQWTIPANGKRIAIENVNSCELIKAINPDGVLHDIFNHDGQSDLEIIRKWLLEGAPLPNEMLEESNHIRIQSHQAFKFLF